MVQLFLRAADGSVKGICFNYKDGDMVDFGCCVAEPGCWYMWKRPQWLLFKPAKDRAVSRSRGFIPIEEIGFVDMYDCPETRMNSICMRERDPLGFRLSKKGLEIDLWFQERFYEKVLERAKRIFERRLETESGLKVVHKSTEGGNRITSLTQKRAGKEASAQIMQAGKTPSTFYKVDFFGAVL